MPRLLDLGVKGTTPTKSNPPRVARTRARHTNPMAVHHPASRHQETLAVVSLDAEHRWGVSLMRLPDDMDGLGIKTRRRMEQALAWAIALSRFTSREAFLLSLPPAHPWVGNYTHSLELVTPPYLGSISDPARLWDRDVYTLTLSRRALDMSATALVEGLRTATGEEFL